MKQYNSSKTPAVVLGLGINGLALVRSLARNDISVFGIYTGSEEIGRFSRYISCFRFPGVMSAEGTFLERLINQFGNQADRPVLLCQSDEYVMFTSRHRDLLQQYFRFLLPDEGLLETLVRKDLSPAYVMSKGLTVPETFSLDNSPSIEQLAKDLTFPCIVKPVDSFSLTFTKKVIVLNNKASFEKFIGEHSDLLNKIIIQRIITGDDSNVYQTTTYVSKNGTLYPIFVMRKIRQYPPGFGVTAFGMTADVSELRRMTKDFLNASQYRGLISMEFKQSHDDKWYYIEMNPRLPYYHKLMLDTGLNFPYAYYLDMLNSEPDTTAVHSVKTNLHWIYFRSDLRGFVKLRIERRIGVVEWCMSLLKARSFAVFDARDILPFIVSPIVSVLRVLKKIIFAKQA